MASGHLLSNLLPLDSVKLGRLVYNAKCAHQDFLDPFEKEILNWLKVELCYGILIYLCCMAWSYFSNYLSY